MHSCLQPACPGPDRACAQSPSRWTWCVRLRMRRRIARSGDQPIRHRSVAQTPNLGPGWRAAARGIRLLAAPLHRRGPGRWTRSRPQTRGPCPGRAAKPGHPCGSHRFLSPGTVPVAMRRIPGAHVPGLLAIELSPPHPWLVAALHIGHCQCQT